MTDAYGQIPLHELTKRHCKFQIVGRKSAGAFWFTTGYHGLTMPTEFQKATNLILANINSVFVYTYDILIVTKGNKQEHVNKKREVMRVLDDVNLQLKARKCLIAQESIEWPCSKLPRTSTSPVNTKSQDISERLRPTCLKQLRSFLRTVNQFNIFILSSASISFPFISILKKDADWELKDSHEKAFKKINEEIKNDVEVSHYKRNQKIRIICDASKQGAVLQQRQKNGEWRPICVVS